MLKRWSIEDRSVSSDSCITVVGGYDKLLFGERYMISRAVNYMQ
jgi:hypothetical protein